MYKKNWYKKTGYKNDNKRLPDRISHSPSCGDGSLKESLDGVPEGVLSSPSSRAGNPPMPLSPSPAWPPCCLPASEMAATDAANFKDVLWLELT